MYVLIKNLHALDFLLSIGSEKHFRYAASELSFSNFRSLIRECAIYQMLMTQLQEAIQECHNITSDLAGNLLILIQCHNHGTNFSNGRCESWKLPILLLILCRILMFFRPTWKKKSISDPAGWEKKVPQMAANFVFSKITVSLFLKIALFICILQFFSCIDILFYFTP